MPATCSPRPQHTSRIGLPLDELGETLEPEKLVQLRIPIPAVERGRIECEVLDLNRFGNVQLNVRDRHVAAVGLDQLDRVSVEAHSGSGIAEFVSTYADLEPGEWGLMVDPRGWLSVVRGNPPTLRRVSVSVAATSSGSQRRAAERTAYQRRHELAKNETWFARGGKHRSRRLRTHR
jgi:S-adenosylmethionine hydrolase